MKERHKAGLKSLARATLEHCGIKVGSQFHTLRTSHIDALLTAANFARYRQPKNANGSRARYYHDLLQRRAQMKD